MFFAGVEKVVEDINTLEEVGVLLIVLQSVVFGATKD
jgi:hypothetical protein